MSPTETRLLLTFPQKVQTIQENANKKRTLEAASQRADALGGRGGQQTIQASFGKGDKEQLLDLAADFFYGCGLSFNVTNNPYFKAYIAGVSAATPGHKPPLYYQLRVPLLARAKARLAPKLAAFLAAAKRTGCVICTDGWSDARNRSLYNFLVVTPSGAYFLMSVTPWGQRSQQPTSQSSSAL